MNYIKINAEVESLNLKWQEFDFGDTLYARIPANLLPQWSKINIDCDPTKYIVEFCADGSAIILTETEQISWTKKVTKLYTKIKSFLSKK